MWEPTTFEDRLLARYFKAQGDDLGTVFLELPVALRSEAARARRIDAVIVPGGERRTWGAGTYQLEDAYVMMRGQRVCLIEAKRSLNRSVIGQLLVADHLVARAVEPSEIELVALCSRGNLDLEDFCQQQGIEICFCPLGTGVEAPPCHDEDDLDGRVDQRNPPDKARLRAFLTGWTAAVNGTLYGSVQTRKTHANMGNLFGWIYGDAPRDFRLATWRRYVEYVAQFIDSD
jgi:hypothetical protein